MKKWLPTIMALLLPAMAQAAGYAGVDYVFSTIEPDERIEDADVEALQFKFGTWFNPEQTFAGELRAALGTDDDRYGRTGVKVEIDRYYGAYLRGQFPDTLPVRPYGLLGVTRVETTEKSGISSDGENYTDISLGIGADMRVADNVFVSLEYLRAIDRSGDEISNLSLGFGGRF